DHHLYQLFELYPRLPFENPSGFRHVAPKLVHLGGTEIPWVDLHVSLPIEVQMSESQLEELAHRMRFAGGDDEVLRLLLLQHQPHRLHVVRRVTPIPLGVEIAEVELVLQAELDSRRSASDFTRNKCFASPRRLVIEKDSVAGEQAVRLAKIDRNPKRVQLGH